MYGPSVEDPIQVAIWKGNGSPFEDRDLAHPTKNGAVLYGGKMQVSVRSRLSCSEYIEGLR